MWRLRQLWLGRGWSHDTLLRYVVDGMNYTPARPAFEDMRDGILASVTNLDTELDPQTARCVVWEAFAQYGVGVGANGVEVPLSITESFAMPAECSGPPANTAPTVTISQPSGSISVVQGTTVTFAGSATDTEDGVLTGSLVWTSNLQGQIGTGAGFTRGDLVLGVHTVTARVTDSGSLQGSATVQVTVTAPTSLTLSARGYKQKGVRKADLSWSGASGGTVDVYRNNTLVTTTANDGAHTDTIPGKGGGTFSYRVCNAGTSTCSNTVTVTF
jgi:hypothetical protein